MSKKRQGGVTIDQWWEETFKEREELLRATFGTTSPLGWVTAFSWDHPRLMIPGACALTFPPKDHRKLWLCLSHGLTQPLNPIPRTRPGDQSAYGWEFGILTPNECDWSPLILYELLTYIKETDVTIGPGQRVPMVFYEEGGKVRPQLRDLQLDDPYLPLGEMRALLIWPYLFYPERFTTSTGSFGILIGTSITGREWEMAKDTSTGHVLLLLLKTGIGQLSDISRTSIWDVGSYTEEWEQIRHLPEPDVEDQLFRMTKEVRRLRPMD